MKGFLFLFLVLNTHIKQTLTLNQDIPIPNILVFQFRREHV